MEIDKAKAIELLSYIPARPDYDTWIRVISAIGNSFDEKTALEILKTRFRDERPNEIAYKLQNRLRDVNFGTLVHLAKQYGYHSLNSNHTLKSPVINRNFSKSKQGINYQECTKENPKLIYQFTNYEFEERASIYEFEAGFERFEADELIIKENPDVEKERVFRVAINKSVINKNCHPETNKPYKDYTALTNNWINKVVTLNQLISYIKRGFAFMPCWINGIRKQENFLFSEIFAIDIDEGLTIERALDIPETSKALFLYTTCNHTNDNHRFRIVFALPRLINSIEVYKEIVNAFIKIYNADKNCKEPTRAFFGNNNAIVYNIRRGLYV